MSKHETQIAQQLAAAAAPEAAVSVAVAAAAPEAAKPPYRIVFVPPAYAGKDPDKKPNLADAALVGFMGPLRLQLAGFTLAKSGSSIVVYMPSTARVYAGVPAVPALRVPPPPGYASGAADGLSPKPGARADLERLHDAIRTAWHFANVSGRTTWRTELPLDLASAR